MQVSKKLEFPIFHSNMTGLAHGLWDSCIAHIFNISLRWSSTSWYLPDEIHLYHSINGTSSVSLILCFTRDVLPRSILFIANILVYSSMRSHTSFWSSKLQSHNPIKSVLSKNSLYKHIYIHIWCTYTCMHVYICRFMHVSLHTYMDLYIYIHTYIHHHVSIHTYLYL